MKIASILLVGAALAALAGCADAPPYGPPPPPYGPPPPPRAEAPAHWDIAQRIHWVQDRINHGRDDGSLDGNEYRRVQGELNSIKHEAADDRAANGGHLDGPTRANLENRLNQLNDQIHWLRTHDEARPW
jgi:hypothetical protein